MTWRKFVERLFVFGLKKLYPTIFQISPRDEGRSFHTAGCRIVRAFHCFSHSGCKTGLIRKRYFKFPTRPCLFISIVILWIAIRWLSANQCLQLRQILWTQMMAELATKMIKSSTSLIEDFDNKEYKTELRLLNISWNEPAISDVALRLLNWPFRQDNAILESRWNANFYFLIGFYKLAVVILSRTFRLLWAEVERFIMISRKLFKEYLLS